MMLYHTIMFVHLESESGGLRNQVKYIPYEL